MTPVYVSLRSGKRIRSVYREGDHQTVGGIRVYKKRAALESPEVCFVAGKSVGNAVQRNRAKRRLKEAARRIDFEPAMEHVFVATRDVLDVPFDTLIDWMRTGAGRTQNAGGINA